MGIYVAEIDGQAIVAFAAEDSDEAKVVAAKDWFKADLLSLEWKGQPLWNGVSNIKVRKAGREERSRWEISRANAIRAGNGLAQEDWVAFLVPVTDPADVDDDG